MRTISLFLLSILIISNIGCNEFTPSLQNKQPIDESVIIDFNQNYLAKTWKVSIVPTSETESYKNIQYIDLTNKDNAINNFTLFPLFDYYVDFFEFPDDGNVYVSNAPIGEHVYIDRRGGDFDKFKFNLNLSWEAINYKDGAYLVINHHYLSYPICIEKNENDCDFFGSFLPEEKVMSQVYKVFAANEFSFAITAHETNGPYKEFIVLFEDASKLPNN